MIWLFSLVFDQREWTVFDRDYDYLILASLDTLLVGVVMILFVRKLSALVVMQKSECLEEMSLQASSQKRSQANIFAVAEHPAEVEMQPVVSPVVRDVVTVRTVQQNMSSRQTRLIFVMTRCTILNLFAFATTIVFGFFAFIYVRYGTHLYFLYSAWSLDMLINSICLYLSFAFSTKAYSKCCGQCHKRCQNLMTFCAAKRILHQHVQQGGDI
mmetsp:Transcript_49427/g.82267  ORF Transcript_49427/g.82267 Transcript_49427/m.82267 type:complete len:213 (-) Transcript_49427:40-678(-)